VRTPQGLAPVPVVVELSDNVTAAVTGEGLREGVNVVTGATMPGTQSASAAPSSGSPLMPAFPRARAASGARRGQ
jgi:hypothetical protein